MTKRTVGKAKEVTKRTAGKAKEVTERTAGCGIQIKVIHNYKAETIKSSTDEDTINTSEDIFLKFFKALWE